MTSIESGVTQGIATAYEGPRLDGLGLIFKTEPHPDRLEYTIALWDAINGACEVWDQESDVNIRFTSGDSLWIPAHLFGKAYIDWIYHKAGIEAG